MNDNGGQSYDTLYPCVCMIDRIAAEMTYDEFAQAQVFTQLRSTAGERGGLFRDPEQAQVLAEQLEGATEKGRAACFVRNGRPLERAAAAEASPAEVSSAAEVSPADSASQADEARPAADTDPASSARTATGSD